MPTLNKKSFSTITETQFSPRLHVAKTQFLWGAYKSNICVVYRMSQSISAQKEAYIMCMEEVERYG
jgi:hypothetical protein